MGTLRMVTAGESHGPAEVCIIEGVPAGLTVTAADIDAELARRRRGYGRGGRQAFESDQARFLAGVRHGKTLGSPVCIVVENQDHAHWAEVMSPDAPALGGGGATSRVTLPRPGHADLTGLAKHGHNDTRNVLERASARETVGRVAGGALCKLLLKELGVSIRSRVVAIGSVALDSSPDLCRPDELNWQAIEASPVACDDPAASAGMCVAIDAARVAGESLGGVFEVWCWGVCPGLGGYAAMEDRLDGRLIGALASIPAIKGAEVGEAFANAAKPGSQVHDALVLTQQRGQRWIGRTTNRAAGIEGGMSNGMPIVLRAAMKPIPTLTTPLPSVDVGTLQPAVAHVERSDISAVPAAAVVGEAMVAYVVAAAYLEKFGGDSMADLLSSVRAFESSGMERGLWRRS